MVTALLHAGDAVCLAENEEQVKRGLMMLEVVQGVGGGSKCGEEWGDAYEEERY